MGHFYDRKGTPCYYVNGRDVTLRDARKSNWVPSVTEITQIIAKPALTDYFIKQGAKWVLGRLDGYFVNNHSEDEVLQEVCVQSRAAAKAAAATGSEIHDACEKLVKGEPFDPKYDAHAQAAVAELHRLFPGVTDWVAEKSFAHPLGYGGKVDLHSPSTGIVADYKTKDGDFSDGKKLAWDQHIQLAAYQVGLLLCGFDAISSDNDPDDPILNRSIPARFVQCANIFVSRTHPGAVRSHVWSADEVAQGWAVFEATLTLWRALKQYDPRF